MKYLFVLFMVMLMKVGVAEEALTVGENGVKPLSPELHEEDMPCDQLFYSSAAACDLEGFMETNDVVMCIAFKMQGSPCELEITEMEEVNVCGEGCAPNWLSNVEDSLEKSLE